jgi:hypothetical protein
MPHTARPFFVHHCPDDAVRRIDNVFYLHSDISVGAERASGLSGGLLIEGAAYARGLPANSARRAAHVPRVLIAETIDVIAVLTRPRHAAAPQRTGPRRRAGPRRQLLIPAHPTRPRSLPMIIRRTLHRAVFAALALAYTAPAWAGGSGKAWETPPAVDRRLHPVSGRQGRRGDHHRHHRADAGVRRYVGRLSAARRS